MLVVLCGLPGTGKTTLAQKLAKRMNAALLRTDVIRKQILKRPLYTEKEKETVYREMFRRAKEHMLCNGVVILDGNFYKKSLRRQAKKIAEQMNEKFVLIECVLSEDLVRHRIASRGRSDDSDATSMQIYYKIKDRWEPIEEPHLVADTSKPDIFAKIFLKLDGLVR